MLGELVLGSTSESLRKVILKRNMSKHILILYRLCCSLSVVFVEEGSGVWSELLRKGISALTLELVS